MKATKYFVTYLPALLFIMFSQGAAAHMLFNYKTAEMQFYSEEAYQTENGNPAYVPIFENQTFQADISFLTPDIVFDLEEMEVVTFEFNNPVTSVITSGVFENAKIEGSHFWLEAWKIDGEIYTDWHLLINIRNNNLPNGTSAFAILSSRGNWDYFDLVLSNYLYTRDMFEARLEVMAFFAGEHQGEYPNDLPGLPRFSVTHVSVPEPLTPALLLLGMVGIFVARKISTP
jgi:hypothetical protein